MVQDKAQLHVPQTAAAPTVGSSKSQNLRCSQWSYCGTGLLVTDTLKECSVCTCRVKWSNTWNMRHCNPSTHQQLVIQQNSLTCQINAIFSCLFLLTLYFCTFLSLSGFNHKWPPFPAATSTERSSTHNNHTTTVSHLTKTSPIFTLMCSSANSVWGFLATDSKLCDTISVWYTAVHNQHPTVSS